MAQLIEINQVTNEQNFVQHIQHKIIPEIGWKLEVGFWTYEVIDIKLLYGYAQDPDVNDVLIYVKTIR